MEPLWLLQSISSSGSRLAALPAVKINQQQCRTLIERVTALTPGLETIEGQLMESEEEESKESIEDVATIPPLPDDLTLHLCCLLTAIEDALSLVAKFSSAACFRRLWEKSDYSDDFASIHSMLLQAASDLRLNLGGDGAELWSAERQLSDAQADLADISRSVDRILQSVEAGVQISAASTNSDSSSLSNPAALPSAFPAVRFGSDADKQRAVSKWQLRVAAEISAVGRERSPPRVVALSASASSASSASSPLRSLSSDLPQIPLSDLVLDKRPSGFGGHGTVYHRAWSVSRDHFVAVKMLRVPVMTDSLIAAFDAEMSLLHSLRHAHIVGLLGCAVDEANSTYLMVMGERHTHARWHARAAAHSGPSRIRPNGSSRSLSDCCGVLHRVDGPGIIV